MLRRLVPGHHLSEAGLARRARRLIARCEHLGAGNADLARRLLRRRARVVGPALARDEALRAELIRVLVSLGRKSGELVESPPEAARVAWEEVGSLADLRQQERGSDAVCVGCVDGDPVSEAEALCALGEGPRVVLALVGEGPPMVVRSWLLEEAASHLSAGLPARELPRALTAVAELLGLEVRRV